MLRKKIIKSVIILAGLSLFGMASASTVLECWLSSTAGGC